jgi:hypothetical protein
MKDSTKNFLRQGTKKIRDLRDLYLARFGFRVGVLLLTVVLYFVAPQSFDVMKGVGFFQRFSWLDLLWLYWIVDMVLQLVPSNRSLALGSLKQFRHFYRPIKEKLQHADLREIFRKGWLDSWKVLGIWTLLVAGIGILWKIGVLKEKELLLVSVGFFVLDLTFVLFWCPFRTWILKTRCCTTCRIFNWGHLMMFSPLLFVPGFFAFSLFGLSAVVFLVWEARFLLYPERFFEETNEALRCANCTDPLCGKSTKRA